MNIACCPYCKGDRFTNDVIRADRPNPDAPSLHGLVYGHWVNECHDCGGWSLHKDGEQIAIQNKGARPVKHSRAPIK
jgi:hypothetical protein